MTSSAPFLIERARSYLRLCEQRRLTEAGSYLAPEALLIFPGNRRFTTPEQMAAGSTGRYRSVSKTIDFSALGQRAENGRPCVVIAGTLHGERLDGSAFENVRFCDLFVFNGELITEHLVYNDLAEAGILPRL